MDLKQAKELVRSRLSDKRYEHTINVKKMAVKLAKHYGTDPEQAALAALLHDAAKELPKDEMRAIMQAHPEYAQGGEARPTPVWHGICAAILARTEWGVTDEAVLSAIACHTAGKAGMTQLDKILYLADMTSAERDWPGVEKRMFLMVTTVFGTRPCFLCSIRNLSITSTWFPVFCIGMNLMNWMKGWPSRFKY